MNTEKQAFEQKLSSALWDIARAPGWHYPTTDEMCQALEPFTEKRASGGLALLPALDRIEIYARRLARVHRESGGLQYYPWRNDRRILEAHMGRDCTDVEVDLFTRIYDLAWTRILPPSPPTARTTPVPGSRSMR